MATDIFLNHVPLVSIGFVECNVPPDVFQTVKQEIDNILLNNFVGSKPYNQKLAGSIAHEYVLEKSANKLESFLKAIIPGYLKLNGHSEEELRVKQFSILSAHGLPDVWVNFQQKHEYNPIHNHGGDISFVMWVKVPYKLEEEYKLPHVPPGREGGVPSFNFIYPHPVNTFLPGHRQPWVVNAHPIYVTEEHVGKMILFPAWLQHFVTPFYTSDDYRISVAGNLTLCQA